MMAGGIKVIENVFVCPAPGQTFVEAGDWRVRVIPDEINVDAHLETPWADADFALVVGDVSAMKGQCCIQSSGVCVNETKATCQQLGGRFFEGATCETALITCPPLE